MRAMVITRPGGPEVLRLIERPPPVPGEGEIRVRVEFAGVNPVDAQLREGLYAGEGGYRYPFIPGWEMAGVVESLGPAVTDFTPGERVFAYCRGEVNDRDGAYAEYVTVPATATARVPARIAAPDAASVPLRALTAWQALFELGRLARGETALVLGAAGGVGRYAVALARSAGALVLGGARESSAGVVRSLGAELVSLDAEQPRGPRADVIVDVIGLSAREDVLALARPGARWISVVEPSVDGKEVGGVAFRHLFSRPDGVQLAAIAARLESGELSPLPVARVPLERAAEAQEARRTPRGAFVVLSCGSPTA